jgi:serine/threonine protein kinase
MQLAPNILFHNRYRLVELKGRGSFGEVWLAYDEQLDNMEVAVKIYISLDARGLQEFGTEYRNTYGLNHPNLLRAYHYEMCEDRPYLVMPYCPGSATDYIGNIDEQKMWHFIHDVASGLAYLHGKDIIHHDIKPDNILEDANGRFVISDFGISVKMRSTLRRNSNRQFNSNSVGGSMAYMGPEMFASQAESVKATDIWALGATLYEMATGELPCFGQGGAMMLNGGIIERPQLPYSDGLINTILGCLAKDTWDRPTARQLVERSNDALAGRPVIVAAPPVGDSEPHSWQAQTSHDPHSTPNIGQRSNDAHGTVKYIKQSDKPHDYTKTPRDNGNTGGTLQEGQGVAPAQNKKKSKVWIWLLLVLLLLGGGAAWKVSDDIKKTERDNTYYNNCRTANDFRNYLQKFPEGRNVDQAKSKLNKLVNDSIARLNKQQTEPLANNQPKAPEPKPDQKKKPEKKGQSPNQGNSNSSGNSSNHSYASTPSSKKPQIQTNEEIYSTPRNTTKDYDDGSRYEGSALPSGVKQGYGKLTQPGSPYKKIYTGDWKNDKRNGYGEQQFENGNKYKGNWKDDKRHGFGTMYDSYGNILESGNYVNGVIQ